MPKDNPFKVTNGFDYHVGYHDSNDPDCPYCQAENEKVECSICGEDCASDWNGEDLNPVHPDCLMDHVMNYYNQDGKN